MDVNHRRRKTDINKDYEDNRNIFNEFNENLRENLLNQAIENKIEYIDYIEECEKEREKYNNRAEVLLNNLKKEFKTLIYLFHKAINNYIKDKIQIHQDIIEMNKYNDEIKYSKIEYQSLTLSFIKKNGTKIIPLNKLEFLPYKLNKNEINKKLAKFAELSRQEKDNIFIEIKKFLIIKKYCLMKIIL